MDADFDSQTVRGGQQNRCHESWPMITKVLRDRDLCLLYLKLCKIASAFSSDGSVVPHAVIVNKTFKYGWSICRFFVARDFQQTSFILSAFRLAWRQVLKILWSFILSLVNRRRTCKSVIPKIENLQIGGCSKIAFLSRFILCWLHDNKDGLILSIIPRIKQYL